MFDFMQTVYPGHNWEDNFSAAYSISKQKQSRRYQQEVLNDIARKLEITHLGGWYSKTTKDVQRFSGSDILKEYGDSLAKCLMYIYPNYSWSPHSFTQAPSGYWTDSSNQQRVVNEASKKLGVSTTSELFELPSDIINDVGLKNIVGKYGGVVNMIERLYPEQTRVVPKQRNKKDKFKRKRGWDHHSTQVRFLEHVRNRFKIHSVQEWYRISSKTLCQVGGYGFIPHFPTALGLLYPNFYWDWDKFSTLAKKSKQR
mmetsp:Transcript_21747/g.24276  ORF Transcript_21747/g.24276 Transcript_21747/m.24276 type:complete len:256 (+) Transcript_21747:22-789(+)